MSNDIIRIKGADDKGMVYTTKSYRDANHELCKQCANVNDCYILNGFNRRSEIMDVEVNITHCSSFKKGSEDGGKLIFPDL